MLTNMWFLIVPKNNPDAPGEWVMKRLRTDIAAQFEFGIWAYYEQVARCTSNQFVAIASRVPPHYKD